MLSVQIAFRGSDEDGSLVASIYNPAVLPAGLSHQVKRYGLSGASNRNPNLTGRVKGSRKALTELIQTYGLTLDVVPFRQHERE